MCIFWRKICIVVHCRYLLCCGEAFFSHIKSKSIACFPSSERTKTRGTINGILSNEIHKQNHLIHFLRKEAHNIRVIFVKVVTSPIYMICAAAVKLHIFSWDPFSDVLNRITHCRMLTSLCKFLFLKKQPSPSLTLNTNLLMGTLHNILFKCIVIRDC